MDSRTHCKETTEDYFALDIRGVKRHGVITEGQEGSQASPASSGDPPDSEEPQERDTSFVRGLYTPKRSATGA